MGKQLVKSAFTEERLQKKTVAELREIIKDRGIKATSKTRKAELISLILNQKKETILDDASQKLAKRIEKELADFRKTIFGDPAKKDSLDSIAKLEVAGKVKVKAAKNSSRRTKAGKSKKGTTTTPANSSARVTVRRERH